MSRLVVTLCALLVLSGCVGTQQAYSAAEGLEETAFVFGEHYEAVQTEIIRAQTNGRLTGSANEVVKKADRDASPVMVEMTQLAELYADVQNAETEAEFEDAVNAAAIALADLINAYKGAR